MYEIDNVQICIDYLKASSICLCSWNILFEVLYMRRMVYELFDWNQFCRRDVYCTDEYIFVQLNEFQDPVMIYKNAN